MSFGVVQSAITSMKNNRSLLSKKDRLKNTLSSSIDKNKPVYSKSTLRMLHHIKQRLKEERRNRLLKIILVFGFVISVVLSVFFYLL
ncbi:MAG: hypothetical protein P8X62_07200 [Flavobacteriaceae bacterium]